MVFWRTTRSAITCDIGAAGARACQVQRSGAALGLYDSLAQAVPPEPEQGGPPAPRIDPALIESLIARGRFAGRDLALVLSPPEVQFFPMSLPPQALAQPAERVQQALRWEIQQESRKSVENLEVRYWALPQLRRQHANVMAVVLPTDAALGWCNQLAEHGLRLRHIDVSPRALAHLVRCLWTPGAHDLWGVLDLGLRRTVLTLAIGATPTYIRVLNANTQAWLRQLATAFEVSTSVAASLLQQHGFSESPRGWRAGPGGANLLDGADLPAAMASVLRENLLGLTDELSRCFSYMLQSYPEVSAQRLYLAGGGANWRGLAEALSAALSLQVEVLARTAALAHPPAERAELMFEAPSAAALGGALLELEAR